MSLNQILITNNDPEYKPWANLAINDLVIFGDIYNGDNQNQSYSIFEGTLNITGAIMINNFTYKAIKNGDFVYFSIELIPDMMATANAPIDIYTLPDEIKPSGSYDLFGRKLLTVKDNGSALIGSLDITADGIIHIYAGINNENFTNGTTVGVPYPIEFSYQLNRNF